MLYQTSRILTLAAFLTMSASRSEAAITPLTSSTCAAFLEWQDADVDRREVGQSLEYALEQIEGARPAIDPSSDGGKIARALAKVKMFFASPKKKNRALDLLTSQIGEGITRCLSVQEGIWTSCKLVSGRASVKSEIDKLNGLIESREALLAEPVRKALPIYSSARLFLHGLMNVAPASFIYFLHQVIHPAVTHGMMYHLNPAFLAASSAWVLAWTIYAGMVLPRYLHARKSPEAVDKYESFFGYRSSNIFGRVVGKISETTRSLKSAYEYSASDLSLRGLNGPAPKLRKTLYDVIDGPESRVWVSHTRVVMSQANYQSIKDLNAGQITFDGESLARLESDIRAIQMIDLDVPKIEFNIMLINTIHNQTGESKLTSVVWTELQATRPVRRKMSPQKKIKPQDAGALQPAAG